MVSTGSTSYRGNGGGDDAAVSSKGDDDDGNGEIAYVGVGAARQGRLPLARRDAPVDCDKARNDGEAAHQREGLDAQTHRTMRRILRGIESYRRAESDPVMPWVK